MPNRRQFLTLLDGIQMASAHPAQRATFLMKRGAAVKVLLTA